MNGPVTNSVSEKTDRRALEALVIENPELERLEAMLDQFNLFEAIGVYRQELRHSEFLSFLLNPQERHGLEDLFAKRLLQAVLLAHPDASFPVNLIELDVWDMRQVIIRREWQNIDILLLSDTYKLAVIIENKVDSSEHSDQLRRYWNIVHERYPDYRIVGLFLTPNGEQPSFHSYHSFSYKTVCEVIERIIERSSFTISADVQTVMTHYSKMLRRHIVGESEIAKLCQQIYHKHRRAIDLIIGYRSQQRDIVRDVLKTLVRQTPELVQDTLGDIYTRFALGRWDDSPLLREGQGWTRSRRMLLFEFVNAANTLDLALCLGPGPADTRAKIYEVAARNQPLFEDVHQGLHPKYNWLFHRRILTPEMYETYTSDELIKEVQSYWDDFLNRDLPAIDGALRTEHSLWSTVNADARSKALLQRIEASETLDEEESITDE